MCDALRELMKPEMDEAVDQAVGEALNTADINKIKSLMSNTGWSVDKAMDALDIANDKREKYRGVINAEKSDPKEKARA